MELVDVEDVYPYEEHDVRMNPRDVTSAECRQYIAQLAEQFKRNRLNPGQPRVRPILYRDGGVYMIVDGECRYEAMKLIGTKRFYADVFDDLDDAEEARRLAEAILEVKQEVHFCSRCFNYATADECSICQDSMRDTTRICVVGEPRDVQAIERTGSYHGLYHVLGGVISPMDKIGPEQLHIRELLARLGHEDIHEVIIATNPNIEGETTASYLARTIKPLGVEVSRLASGLPVGGDLEYADELTLGRAIEARRAI